MITNNSCYLIFFLQIKLPVSMENIPLNQGFQNELIPQTPSAKLL